MHGLDIRTETFRGNTVDAVRERLVTSDEQTLLVIGLSAPERCSDLVDDLQKLLREQPPAAVLFVSGRDRSQTQTQTQTQPQVAVFSL
jgi:arginine utilization protein RocB